MHDLHVYHEDLLQKSQANCTRFNLDEADRVGKKLLYLQSEPIVCRNEKATPLNKSIVHRYAEGHLLIRKRRKKSTWILGSIVAIFIICHIFRLSLRV